MADFSAISSKRTGWLESKPYKLDSSADKICVWLSLFSETASSDFFATERAAPRLSSSRISSVQETNLAPCLINAFVPKEVEESTLPGRAKTSLP